MNMNHIFAKKNEQKLSIFFMVLALFVSCLLIFTKNPYYGHDIGFHLSRIQSITDCLKNGVFPAVIYPNYFEGAGYGNGLFYPDLFLYLPALFVYFGIPCKIAYHIFLFIINLATLLSMFYCARRVTDHSYTAAVIGCLYLLCSYRLTDLYERAALGETLCFIFMPFVMLGVYEILLNDQRKGYYTVIGLFGVLSSHVITIVFSAVFIIFAYLLSLPLLIHKNEWKVRTMAMFIWCSISIGLCAYFLFPFLEAYLSDTYMFKSAPATGGWDRAMPFILSLIEIPTYRTVYFPLGIGIVYLIIIFLSIIKLKDTDKDKVFIIEYLILGLAFFIFSTDLFPWKLFKGFAQLIQFPWRFLIISSTALLYGFSPILRQLFETEKKKIRYTLLMILCCGFTVFCFAAELFIINDFHLYTDEVHYSLGGVEYLPSDTDPEKLISYHDSVFSNHPISIEMNKKGTSVTVSYKDNSYSDTYIEIPLVYYKGYKAKQGDQFLNVSKGENGLVRIESLTNQGTFDLYYGSTPIRLIGYSVTLISFILLILLIRKK